MALNGRRDCYLSLLPMEILAHVVRHSLPHQALGEVTVALPDGRLVVVEEDAITGVESLFDPSVLGQRSHDDAANAQAQGLRPALHLSYTRSDLDLRTEMCKNVLLVGSLPAVACCWANRVVADHFLHTHTHTQHTQHNTHTHNTTHHTQHTHTLPGGTTMFAGKIKSQGLGGWSREAVHES